jgi:hypothetical protein
VVRVLYSKLPYDLDKTSCPWPFPVRPLLVVGVPEKIGVNTMRELIDYAKKSPVNMGGYAAGSWVADQTNQQRRKIVTVSFTGVNRRCGWMWPLNRCGWAIAIFRDGQRAASDHRRDEAPTAPQLPGVPTHSAGHRTVVGAACHRSAPARVAP